MFHGWQQILSTVLVLLEVTNAFKPQKSSQQYLGQSKTVKSLDDVVHALKKSEVIPAVLDPFEPKVHLQLLWPNGHTNLGNTLKPNDMKFRPRIATVADHSVESRGGSFASSPHNLILTMTDPDAPSRKDPKWSEICHYIVHLYLPKAWPSLSANADDETLVEIDLEEETSSQETKYDQAAAPFPSALPRPIYNTIIDYRQPGPPPKTGKHRYVFTMWVPANMTTAPLLHLTQPKERVYWGFEEAGRGVQSWAGENELIPIAANFVYAKHHKKKLLDEE